LKDLPSTAEVDATLLSDFGITATSSADDSGKGLKLFAGYRLNQNWAVEGGYADLGEATWNSIVTAPSSGTVSISWKAEAWSLAAIGILPVSDQFEIFGKVGGFFYNADASATATGGGVAAAGSEDDDGAGWLVGVGASYSLTKNIAVRAEWEGYQNVGDENTTGKSDINMLSVGIQYKF
jgi:OOP family OmpA-OmpF porin